jgi:hypothetical protein
MTADEDFYRNEYPDTESSEEQHDSADTDSDDYVRADARYRRRAGLGLASGGIRGGEEEYESEDD